MPDFYPYGSFTDAQRRLCRFADATVGPAAGISFTSGSNIGALRLPGAGAAGEGLWLNVLVRSGAQPSSHSPATGERFGHLKAWFDHLMSNLGRLSVENASRDQAGNKSIADLLPRIPQQTWQSLHEFMLRHQLAADTVGIAMDVVGVLAGVVFVVAAAPELAAAGTVVATVGLVTGSAAFAGSILLTLLDGVPYFAALDGDEAFAKRVEEDHVVQWLRIAATVMLLPDIPVGGSRSLVEIGKLRDESEVTRRLAAAARDQAAAARDRAGAISHPSKHPVAVNRRLHRANALTEQAMRHSREADEASSKLRTVKYRDLYAFQGASLVGSSLLAAVPPEVVLTERRSEMDEEYRNSFAPAGGMPNDVRLEMRVSSHGSCVE